MTSVRSSKTKGNTFEYDCAYSLKPSYPDIEATQKTGFVQGIDLISSQYEAVFECKRHKSFSWNELVKYYEKLVENSPTAKERYVVFQPNRQPVLVFYNNLEINGFCIGSFRGVFAVDFHKRPKGYTKSLLCPTVYL